MYPYVVGPGPPGPGYGVADTPPVVGNGVDVGGLYEGGSSVCGTLLSMFLSLYSFVAIIDRTNVTIPLLARNLAIANRLRSASYNSLSGRIRRWK